MAFSIKHNKINHNLLSCVKPNIRAHLKKIFPFPVSETN